MSTENETIETLKVTSVQVYPFSHPVDRKLGLASVVLNDQLLIRDLRIVDGENGIFVAYPIVTKEHDPEGFQRSAVFPIIRALREHIENAVLEKYQAAVR